MALDQEIYRQRREKLERMRTLGVDPYPTGFAFTHSLGGLADEFGSAAAERLEAERIAVCVCGRMVALRAHGRAGFAHLQQDGRRLQIYVRQDAVPERAFAIWKLLDLGDLIGVAGHLFRTRTGELTVHVEGLEFLSKDLLPLPEKWHGLSDVELRYRQRYLDLIMNPEARAVFVKRSRLAQTLRRFLDARGFLEVETPMMQAMAGGAMARPFVTHHQALDLDLYLRIAPELYLKRLLVGGFDRVYEINRNFRNEGLGWRWNPEFTMLEFYQAYADCGTVMELTEALLEEAARAVTGGTEVAFGDERLDFDRSRWRRLTMREAIVRFWPEGAPPPPRKEDFESAAAVATLAERLYREQVREQTRERATSAADAGKEPRRIAVDPAAPAGAAIAELFEAVAEEHLVQPTTIHEFPAAISPLAKQKAGEPEWAERFEIFAGGMEIANGFSELNDPEEQRRRFALQLRQRERGDEEAHRMDEDYLRALAYGMPPAGGVGVGVDRLAMLLTDSPTIRDVILFPLLRPEGGAP